MRSTFTRLSKKLIIAIIYVLTISLTQAQDFTGQWGKTTGGCTVPSADCLNPENVIPNLITNTSTTAAATFNFAPLNSWTTLDYTFNTAQNLSGNNLLVTLNGSFGGKFVLIQLRDAAGHQTTYNFNYVLPIPQANTNYEYSIDFHQVAYPVAGTCDLSTISKIRIALVDAQTASNAVKNFTGNLTVTYSMDTKQTNEVDLVPSSVNQVWLQEASNLLYNPFGSGILLGAVPSQIDPKFLYPYYSATIKGRTNIFGNDNALEIWSNNLVNGNRQYLGFSNTSWTTGPNAGTEYSLINSGEYGTGYNSKHLILQNNTGNIGIGTFTQAPKAKLHVVGTTLIGTANYKVPTRWIGSLVGGVADPTYALAVEGYIVSQKSVVTAPTNWADFVFESNYCRPSLEDQENFIKQNGHLKDIPTEKEILENGYDVAEMDAKFLQKMEELYLYTIELKKDLETQKKTNEELQKEIEAIKKQLNK